VRGLSPTEVEACFVELIEGLGWRIRLEPPPDRELRRIALWTTWILASCANLEDLVRGSRHRLDNLWRPILGKLPLGWLHRFLRLRARAQRARREEYWQLARRFDPVAFMRPLDPTRGADARRMRLLLREYIEAEWPREAARALARTDADGLLLPGLVAHLLADAGVSEDVGKLVRLGTIAEFYPEGGAAWRVIAVPLCRVALGMGGEARDRAFGSIWPLHGHTLAGAVGEVHPHFFGEVARLERHLVEERDPGLREYWRLRVRDATRVIERERARVAEEER
jgi:hypothetical protein